MQRHYKINCSSTEIHVYYINFEIKREACKDFNEFDLDFKCMS